MKSLYLDRYGSSEVLSFRDLPKPEASSGQVIVKVHAVSLNPLDWRLMRADPFLIRLYFGLFKPKLHCLGADFSGVVDAVASDVTAFKAGDEIFGLMTPEITGSLSELIAIPSNSIVRKTQALSHPQAATLGVAALTAYEGIHDYRALKAKEKVLINGASGGVGTFAVQMAKELGAHVTGVCSGRNAELVRGLGANEVIDYQTTDLLRTEDRFDLVYDTVGNHPPKALKTLLAPGGRLVLASAGNSWGFLQAMRIAKKDASVDLIIDLKKDQKRLQAVGELATSGKIVPVIDREYSFEETPAAIDYVETKRARGKVVIRLDW
ncbi:MAG: NAD(P)-dependent alcohol dehydrogenase [Verrucomicrobiota bacterium]